MNGILKVKEFFRAKFSFIPKFDFFVLSKVIKIRNKILTKILKLISRIGDWWILSLLSIILIFLNLKLGILLSISLIIQVLLQKIIKNIFTRKRPYIKHRTKIKNLIVPPDRYSFPSGHTAGAFVVFFSFLRFYPEISIIVLVIAIIIGFSRIYLGVHYLTDVIFGIIIGLISTEIANTFYLDIVNLIKQIIPSPLHSQLYQVEHLVFV
ncbi:MAG: phosphatase PAP2 family protein [Brevinematia bacterium]